VILLVCILLAVFVLPAPWNAIVAVVGVVLEAGEITLLRRWSNRMGKRTKVTTGAEAMVGRRAEVVAECRPKGSVRVKGELWEARCEAGAGRGETVVVDGVEELTLLVSPEGSAG
jgi:membrane protein implicated in regulation of membrane protease activity